MYSTRHSAIDLKLLNLQCIERRNAYSAIGLIISNDVEVQGNAYSAIDLPRIISSRE